MSEFEIAKNLRERVNTGNIETIKITYSIGGGPPTKRGSKEIALLGNTDVELIRKDEGRDPAVFTRQREVDPLELKDIFVNVAASIEALASDAKPRFLSDSEVGSITVEVNDKKVTKYFLINEIDRKIQEKSISDELRKVIESVTRIAKKIEGDNHG